MSQSTSVLNIIKTKLLPWILQDGVERFIVARARMKQMKPKSGIGLTYKKLKGPRKTVRIYTFSGASALWPNCKNGRHLEGVNVAFADGHVKWLKTEVLNTESLKPAPNQYGAWNPANG
jgi:prepilin-type processing-associated H-X9-DG protein